MTKTGCVVIELPYEDLQLIMDVLDFKTGYMDELNLPTAMYTDIKNEIKEQMEPK